MSTLPSRTEAVASQECRDDLEIMRTLRDRLTARQELLPELVDQLRTAVQQTEQAVLDISGKFMNVAGRARRQLQTSTDIIGSMMRDRTGATEQHDATLEGLSTETEKLGMDINGIIMSLQFQDITRQEIEKVIGRMVQFQQELMDMKRSLGPESACAPAPQGPCAGIADVNRGEHV